MFAAPSESRISGKLIPSSFSRKISWPRSPSSGNAARLRRQLESRNLQRQWQELCRIGDMRILLMQHQHNLLSDVLGQLTPITRCRESENPFTQCGQQVHNVRIEEAQLPWK